MQTLSTVSMPVASAWYVVHAKPRQESRALENLQNQGYECFFPTMQVEKRRHQRVQVVTEPMFSRYLFIRLDAQAQNWSPIRSTLGVSKLVSFGQQPARVPDDLVAFLREAPSPRVERLFAVGDPVRVARGVFKGLEGIYQAPDGEQRAMVLVELLGQPQRLKLMLDDLLAAA